MKRALIPSLALAAGLFGTRPKFPRLTPCGDTLSSITLCLSSIQSADTLSLEVRNDGSSAAVIDIGIMLANGAGQYPTAVTLLARDPSAGESEGASLDPPGVAGRLDPLVLFLPRGASMHLPLVLSRYQFQSAGPSNAKRLAGGRPYSIRAKLTARPPDAAQLNLDMKGVAVLSFWTGTVVSNQIIVAP